MFSCLRLTTRESGAVFSSLTWCIGTAQTSPFDMAEPASEKKQIGAEQCDDKETSQQASGNSNENCVMAGPPSRHCSCKLLLEQKLQLAHIFRSNSRDNYPLPLQITQQQIRCFFFPLKYPVNPYMKYMINEVSINKLSLLCIQKVIFP